MAKRGLSPPPRRSSRLSGKRSRKSMFDDHAPPLESSMSTNNSADLRDMWVEPLDVSRNTWAVTRCLIDHGDAKTKWTPGHFVAVAMWSGGLEAGIQAAKAIRIFGIWSPHDNDKDDDKLPSLSNTTRRDILLEKLWPTTEYNQDLLKLWARRSNPGIPLPDFEAAHRYLLRESIGPDLTQIPSVVRPKLEYGHGTSLQWHRLVTEEQFWNTLVPVLRKHFDPKVDLVSISQKIQSNAFKPHAKSAYAGRVGLGKSLKTKAGGPSRPSRATDKEINLVQPDDNEDDAEDFRVRPKDEFEVKKESNLSEETTMELAYELYGTPYEERPDTKNSIHGGNEGHEARSVFHRPPFGNSIDKFRVSKPSSLREFTNNLAVQARRPTLLRRAEPHSIRQQAINRLYEQTIGMSTRTIKSFHESSNSRLALPDVWEKILTHWQSNRMWIRGSKDCLPYPRQSSYTSTKPNGTLNPVVKAVQNTAYNALRQNAELDLSALKKFCAMGVREEMIGKEVFVID